MKIFMAVVAALLLMAVTAKASYLYLSSNCMVVTEITAARGVTATRVYDEGQLEGEEGIVYPEPRVVFKRTILVPFRPSRYYRWDNDGAIGVNLDLGCRRHYSYGHRIVIRRPDYRCYSRPIVRERVVRSYERHHR